MKKLMTSLFSAILIITIGGCVPGGRYIRVASESVERSAMITVPAVITRPTLTIREGQFEINETTVAVKISGSGVFISPTGHILTCAHLFDVPKMGAISVETSRGEKLIASLLKVDHSRDLALLKIETKRPVPYAPIARPHSLRVGEEVIAVGNPLRQSFSVSHGIISALNRGGVEIEDATQSDTFINPGNSGGPLFNLSGELVGINSRILPPVDGPVFTGLGYSVSTVQIFQFLETFRGLETAFNG